MKLNRKSKKITDAVEILRRRYLKDTKAQEALEEARVNSAIARDIYELRQKAKLTQTQLANLVGTTASVISRLEDADYEGHSLSMLQRVASALGKRIEVSFVPKKRAA